LKKSLRLAGFLRESIVDGPGVRFVIFVQGCPHRCPNCHNPQTFDFKGGKVYKNDEIFAIIRENPEIHGVTFSGGEPFCQADALSELSLKLKEFGYNNFAYSGYTFEELVEKSKTEPTVMHLLKNCDVLVDGKFEKELKDLTLKFRGSSNQRIIDLRKTFGEGKVVTND
jgi:anaerobic ribonucleoside-triphosphate reductase activating protein